MSLFVCHDKECRERTHYHPYTVCRDGPRCNLGIHCKFKHPELNTNANDMDMPLVIETEERRAPKRRRSRSPSPRRRQTRIVDDNRILIELLRDVLYENRDIKKLVVDLRATVKDLQKQLNK